MRSTRLTPLLLAALLVAGCAAPLQTARLERHSAPQPGASVVEAPPSQSVAARRPLPDPVEPPYAFAQALTQGTRAPNGKPGPRYWQQHARYTLTARLFPEARRLEGAGRIVYTNHAPDTLHLLRLEIAQNLHAPEAVRNTASEMTGGLDLRRVAVAGRTLAEGHAPGYRVRGTQLLLGLPEALAPGASVEIELEWAFSIPQAGAGARMGYSGGDLFFLAYWYPQMAVYDDVYGWFTDPFLGQAEFYADFADYDLSVEAPAGWIVAATGTLDNPDEVLAPAVAQRMRRAHGSDAPLRVVGPDDFGSATRAGDDGRLRWRFSAANVRDVAFSATNASIWEAARTPVGDRDGDGQTDYAAVNTFYRPSAPRWQDVTRYQQHALAHHARFTGFAYPWPHMTAVEGGGIIDGGMEYPMMTLMGDYNERGDDALYYVTAHELGHMWIPMIAGPNERRFSWMDEGATSFLENQTRGDFLPGPDHFDDDRQNYLAAARAEIEGEILRWSDFHYSEAAFGIASYSKPATLLVALRGLLGEETFLRAYRAFLRDWAYKHPYPYDFFNAFEAAAGRDLDWFWDSWYVRTWTLDQAVGRVTQRPGEAEIVVEDRGRAPMPVHLTATLDDGQKVNVNLPVDVWLQGQTQASVLVKSPARVTRVEIDPAQDFPDIDRSNNVWTR